LFFLLHPRPSAVASIWNPLTRFGAACNSFFSFLSFHDKSLTVKKKEEEEMMLCRAPVFSCNAVDSGVSVSDQSSLEK